MEKFILEFEYESGYNAGSKARDDIEYFLRKAGFQPVLLKRSSNLLDKLLKPVTLKKWLGRITDRSVVLVQHPCYVRRWYLDMIIRILKRKQVRMICLIHDLNSLRQSMVVDYKSDEVHLLNQYDIVISHNEKMTKWLKNNNLQTPIVNLGIFDYQTENFGVESKDFDKNSISVAGNLIKQKSGYIYQFNKRNLKDITLNLYGAGYEAENPLKNINYLGTLPPDELPMNIEGGYGLIWDGPSIKKCEGEYGEYMKYNNPHKLSLYIASGLPVVVWKEAAIAEFVNQNKIGIVVDSIEDLSTILLNVDEQAYLNMRKNLHNLRNKVIEGHHIIQAVEKGLRMVN